MVFIMTVAYLISRYIPGVKVLSKRFGGNENRMRTLDIYYILQLIAILGHAWVTYADIDMLTFTRVIEDTNSDASYSYDISIFFIMFIVVYTFTAIAKYTPLTEAEKEQ